MEKASDMGQELLVNELIQGLESAQELWFQDLSSTPELLFNRIKSSFTNALSILTSSGPEVDLPLTSPVASLCYTSSIFGSPQIEGSNQAIYVEEDKATFQKREKKSMDTRHVRMVYLGADLPDDGFSWRKYGQKEILGHKFPRGFYRCTHKNETGCLAKKSVQRSTEDSSILDIMYRGEHTCIQRLSGPPMLRKRLAVKSEDSNQAFYGKGHRATFHEREKQPMRKKQLCPVHPETDPPDDGYRWRRLAQEEIRGATLPMSYYQCSEPGCVAKKRVHRSLEDFSIVDIAYRGVHTCNLGKQEQQQHQETLWNIQMEPKVSHDVQIPGPESYIHPESFGASNPENPITLPSNLDDDFMDEESEEALVHQESFGASNPENPITLPSNLDDDFMDEESEEALVISFDHRKLSGSPMLPKPTAMFSKESSSARDIPHGLHRISVLDLSHTKIESLPESISNLKNLQELLFHHCERLKTVPSLEKLIELRVLDLAHTIIKELPQGMDNLVNLRRLDLSYTRNLQLYPVGVLQKLRLLEDLLMFESRCSWPLNLSDVLGGADIKEIISATHLVNLAIRFVDLPSFVGYVRSRHWQILKSFRFDIGWASNCLPLASFRWKYSVQILGFDLVDEKDSLILPDNTLELVIKNCHGISCLSEMQHVLHLRNLKECSVVDCDGMECILMAEKNTWSTIEELILYNLPNLTTLYRGVPSFGTLASLKSVTVEHCHSLKSLFASELLLHLQNLEYVRLWMCDQIEEIIAEDEGMADSDPSNTITLPRLKELRLGFLRVLGSISKRVVVCDSLVTIIVQNCPKLKKLPLSIGDVPPSLEKIKGSRKWWDALEWDDLDIKTPLRNSFIHQSDLESESELGSESEEEDQHEEEEEEEEERGG